MDNNAWPSHCGWSGDYGPKGVFLSYDVELELGHMWTVGDNVSIIGKGKLTIGDYAKIHRNTLIIVHSDITIGHNCWIGEKCVIDGTGGLTIGDNVGIGIGSSVYTHMSFGDTFSGCRLRSSKKVTIGDEAWLVGEVMLQAASVAPRSVVMAGSNVTSDVIEPNTVWAGNPLQNVTEKYGSPWTDTTIEQRRKKMNVLVKEYIAENGYANRFDKAIRIVDDIDNEVNLDPRVSYFCLKSRTYTRRKEQQENQFMSWLLRHNKAKFTPRNT